MTNSNPTSEADRSPRILVADDTDVNQKIAKLILQRAEYNVDTVDNGQQAVQAHQQKPYDLILMDIQMPIMDGLEATRKIRDWEEEKKNAECGMRNAETEHCELNTAVTGQITEDGEQKIEVGSGNMEMGVRNKIRENSDQNSEFRIPTSDFKKVPIIAMTGNAGPGGFDEAVYPGMNDCVGIPLQMELLQAAVQKWVSLKDSAPAIENPVTIPQAAEKKRGDNQNPLDLDRAVEKFMGQKEILLSVLHKFLTSAGSQIDRIRQAVKEADYGAIGSNAHSIKGAAANLTADKLADLAADMERAADKQQPDLSTELADELEQEFFALKKYIQQIPVSDETPMDQPDVAPVAGPDVSVSG